MSLTTALMGRAEDPVLIDGRQQEALISLLPGGCGDVQPASIHLGVVSLGSPGHQ